MQQLPIPDHRVPVFKLHTHTAHTFCHPLSKDTLANMSHRRPRSVDHFTPGRAPVGSFVPEYRRPESPGPRRRRASPAPSSFRYPVDPVSAARNGYDPLDDYREPYKPRHQSTPRARRISPSSPARFHSPPAARYLPRYDSPPAARDASLGGGHSRRAESPSPIRRHARTFPRDDERRRSRDHDDYRPSRARDRSPDVYHGRRHDRHMSQSPSRPPISSRHHQSGRHRSTPAKSSGRSKSSSRMDNQAWQSAARTALKVGATTAFQVRNEPGDWVGAKGSKVATAALGAALVNSFMEKKHPKKVGGVRHNAMRHAAEMAIGKGVFDPAVRHR